MENFTPRPSSERNKYSQRKEQALPPLQTPLSRHLVQLHRSKSSQFAHLFAALAIIAIAFFQEKLRPTEALLASKILSPTSAWESGSIMWFNLGDDARAGLFATFLYSTLLLWITCLLAFALVMMIRSTRRGQAFLALFFALFLTLLANAVRYGFAICALENWGRVGFDSVHYWYGSFFVLSVTIMACIFILWNATRRRVQRHT